MTLVVNLIGGPGSGKSTIAAYTFAMLKRNNLNVELVTEYAKDKVWEGSLGVLENQIYVFGKQQHKLHRVAKHVDVVIMDSALILSPIYDKTKSKHFKALVLEEVNKYDNLNIFIERSSEGNYSQTGRYQTENEALEIDEQIKDFLDQNSIDYKKIELNTDTFVTLPKIVYNEISKR